jgi:hypothetical protein
MGFTVFFPNPSSPSDTEDQEEVSNTDVASKEPFPLQANLSLRYCILPYRSLSVENATHP